MQNNQNLYLLYQIKLKTNLLTDNVPTVMQYLFYNHRRVCTEEVALKENKAINMTWQLHSFIVLLTYPIENLQKLVQQASILYTDQQLLKKRLQLIRNICNFKYALTHQEQKPVAQQTWTEFKSHFYEVQLNHKKICGSPI